jgi:hypothetical protein
MRRNLVVLLGVIVVAIASCRSAVLTVPERTSGNLVAPDVVVFVAAPAILLVMLLRWRWRGLIWIGLGTAAAILVPLVAQLALNVIIDTVSLPGDSVRTAPRTYTAGLFRILLGYAIVAGGGVWDVARKLGWVGVWGGPKRGNV